MSSQNRETLMSCPNFAVRARLFAAILSMWLAVPSTRVSAEAQGPRELHDGWRRPTSNHLL